MHDKRERLKELSIFSSAQVEEFQKKLAVINQLTLINNQKVAQFQHQSLSLEMLQDGMQASAAHLQILEQKFQLTQDLLTDLFRRFQVQNEIIESLIDD